MTSYRRMRRHARQARRAGMAPMMVISSGDPLPGARRRAHHPVGMVLTWVSAVLGPELINAEHERRVAGRRGDLAVGDRVQVHDPG